MGTPCPHAVPGKQAGRKDILEWGQKAAAKGYYKRVNQGKNQYSEYFNGIKFRVYVDTNTGAITNVHPE